MVGAGLRHSFAFLLILGSFFAQADNKRLFLNVQEPLKVYANPSLQSPVIAKLEKGDKVRLAKKVLRRSWRMALVDVSGTKKRGFISVKDIRLSYVREDNYFKEGTSYRHKWGMGFGLLVSYFVQGDTEFSDSSGESFNADSVVNLGPAAMGYIDIPFENNRLRAYGLFRLSRFMGQAKGSVSEQNTQVNLIESFIGVGATAHLYLGPKTDWWVAAGAELSKGLSTATEATNDVKLKSKLEPSLYTLAILGLGKDIQLGSHIYLIPELRGVLNISPMFYGGEAVLSMSWSF